MTVGEMIQRLQEEDLHLPVALAGWNECYARPSCIEAEERLRMVLIIGERGL